MYNPKKYIYLIFLLCFLTISFSFHLWADEGSRKSENSQNLATSQNQPRIYFDAINFDAGEVLEGKNVVHDFIVKNTGTAELNISKVKAG